MVEDVIAAIIAQSLVRIQNQERFDEGFEISAYSLVCRPRYSPKKYLLQRGFGFAAGSRESLAMSRRIRVVIFEYSPTLP